MPIHKLTPSKIAALIRAGRHGLCGDGGGLYLQIHGGSASWLFRYQRLGQRRYMGLGALATVSLTEAREQALAARKVLHRGADPLAVRKAERAKKEFDAAHTMTFDACVTAYLDAHQAGWKNPKHRQQWKNTLSSYASPVFSTLPVADIDTGPVMRALEPIWSTKPETATRLRGRIESVLSWATVRGYRRGENPARWKGHLDQLLPARGRVRKVKHHAALPYVDLPAFMDALHDQEGLAARALNFLILTAVRTGDIIGGDRDDAPAMCWHHVDLNAAIWTIPKTKTGAAHNVPLSAAAVAVLRTMRARKLGGHVVFPSSDRPGKPLSNMAMTTVLRRMQRSDLTVHGFRATFKTWAAERTNYPRDVVEAALAHTISDRLEAAYRRGDFFDKRRRLMNAWAGYCNTPVEGKVVLLKR